MPARVHLDHAVINSFLRGLTYAMERDELLHLAKINDLTGEYLDAFRSLPHRVYWSQNEVMEEMERQGYSVT
jgi:hypothetical protein